LPAVLLKSLRLKGFKSFADRTDLEFIDGVNCVVGPNGSGKSNVVDALTWVMGVQGARQLRGARMEDVIFMGTPRRQASGRAEAILVFDNASGAFPVDAAEIEIGRLLFRSGESRYTINGEQCRLADVVELLSDAGVGRTFHNVVGQGRIDSILMSTPEDRRVVIEEAAGVLKHRRRRERSLRRLEAVEADLVRLEDHQRELQRQIRPLERQVTGAQRYEALRVELELLSRWQAGESIRTRRAAAEAAAERLVVASDAVGALQHEDDASAASAAALEAAARTAADSVDAARLLRERLDRVVAQFHALAQVTTERRRGLAQRRSAAESAVAAGPLELFDERRQLVEERDALDLAGESLGEAAVAHAAAVREHAASLHELDAAWRAAGLDGDDRRAALSAQLAAVSSSLERAQAELGRLRDRSGAVDERLTSLSDEIDAANAEIERLDASSLPLARRAERLVALRRTAESETRTLAEQHRRRLAEAASLTARAESLEAMVTEAEGSRAAHDAVSRRFGASPRLRDCIRAADGAAGAVAAGLGALADVVVLPDGTAAGAVEAVKSVAEGSLLLGSAPGGAASVDSAAVTATLAAVRSRAATLGAKALVDRITVLPGDRHDVVAALLAVHLGEVFEADSHERALALSDAHPGSVFVTRAGDRFAAGVLSVRSAARTDAVDPALAAADARRRAAVALDHAAAVDDQRTRREAELERLGAEADAAARELAESDGLLTAKADALARLQREHTDLQREQTSVRRQLDELDATMSSGDARRAELDAQLAAAASPVTAEERRLLEERRTALEARGDELQTETLRIEGERARLPERRRAVDARLAEIDRRESEADRRRAAAREDVRSVEAGLTHLDVVDKVIAVGRIEAVRRRDHAVDVLAALQRDRSAALQELDAVRTQSRELARQRAQASEELRAAELAEAEARLRLEAAEEIPGRELGCRIDETLVATLPEEIEPDEVAERIARIEADIRRIGPVNPLALEEYEALTARRDMLESELADVHNAKREIVKVVRQVDDKIAEILATAYEDVGRHFADLFALLFPGGEGRFILTEPDDVLGTGVELECRPSGKTAKRLSLLSGGERSLSALAFLFAVFRARPSPFYVLDEVEAALDDINLHRFCNLLREFRRESQLLVVTHQKRTMETADVLYGVSLGSDGTSRVISQRVHDLDLSDETVAAALHLSGEDPADRADASAPPPP
jgi:chromosome segregation protein